LEDVRENFADLMQMLLELQTDGAQRSPELIAKDERHYLYGSGESRLLSPKWLGVALKHLAIITLLTKRYALVCA
jgi:hypothetical protein